MELSKTTFLVSLVVWSVLSAGHLQASPDEKVTLKSNDVLELQKPNEGRSREEDISESKAADQKPISIDHRSRKKRTAATVAEQSEILRIHNILRQKEGASDMYHMRWNGVLALMAETWANGCNFVHGQPIADTSSLGYQAIGQSLHSGKHPINLTSAVQNWFDEKLDYSFSSNLCASGKICGHYTQLVWSTTYEVGCGYTFCPVLNPVNRIDSILLVCNYGPAGNTIGMKPYQIGAACKNCSTGKYFCNNGLCDNTCTTSGPTCICSAACQNCGTVTSTCTCNCTVGWSGKDCSKPCKNYDARCGANPGWPASLCSSYAFISDACPALCGRCVVGSPPPCVQTTTKPTL